MRKGFIIIKVGLIHWGEAQFKKGIQFKKRIGKFFYSAKIAWLLLAVFSVPAKI